ncbi:trem-like transcript 4 protein isoform X1 [Cavia porcellus]|uniref:trem-like transcript 4 protein isoform X1 n=1 Tax=Cavia porcellus TaxID=10141 RepID=UPI000661AFD0|nr:trem-like transcript 4 protein isoform X5 [Cavia porcellus]
MDKTRPADMEAALILEEDSGACFFCKVTRVSWLAGAPSCCCPRCCWCSWPQPWEWWPGQDCDRGRTCYPGSRLLTADSVELQAVEGQTLTVRCSYTPETGPYVSKSWCRQTSVKSCTRVVTTYQPQTAVEKSRHTIWDDPEAGFLVVNITDLQEDDSGSYWCGNYNASENTIFILRNITLVVSPAPSSAPTWTTTTALVSSPEGTSGLSFNGSEHRRNSGAASSPDLLFLLECGLLALKAALLLVLCAVLCCWWGCRGHKDTVVTEGMEISDYANFTHAPEPLGIVGHIPGHRRNTYSPAPDH